MLNNIKKHAMALAALTIAIGSLTLMSFKAELKSNQTSRIFKYTPPSSTNAFSKSNVEDPNNWEIDETDTPCPTSQNDIACSIAVPLSNTMNGGQELDPSKVSITTQQSSINNHRVILGSGYSSPVNKTKP